MNLTKKILLKLFKYIFDNNIKFVEMISNFNSLGNVNNFFIFN